MANFGDSSWIGDETEYTYDTDGKLLYIKTVYYEQSGEKSHYVEVNCYYDNFNRLIKEEKTSFDNDGIIKNTDIKEYKDFVK